MLLYRPKQKISTTASEEVKFPASSIDGLATVATSGSYNDLTDKPEVPGVPDIMQTTGTSTTAVMSQKAVTDELDKKANSADLANYVTTNTEQDIKGKKTVVPPSNKDNSNQIATTAWAGRRYKSIADFGFTSQTTVKAIVQKIIDNWYEYCTFACTNDNFNNFSDTPDGYGTLIIEVGSNALRPLISFTKQIGDSNSYKYWQANIVRGENNQVSEIQWYQVINDTLPQTISGAKTFVSNIYISQTSGQNAGITWKSASDNTNRGIFRHYDDGTTENFVTQSNGFLFRPLNNNNTKSIKVDPAAGVLYPEQNSGADLGKTAQRWNAVYAGNTGVRSTGSIICDSKVISYSAVESNKEVPDFNGILKDDLYTKSPTKTRGAQYLARDKNGAYIGGLRIYHDTNGTIQSQLLCRSQNTDVQNYVYFQAQPDATSNANKDKFAFIPHTNGNIDLGLPNNKWNNGYITNIKGCKVINDGGDNLTINGTATVATPPDTDDSTQIANTAWVRSHNQAHRGFDGPNYYTVDGVKKYYPADNYFLVAYTDHCDNWKHVCAEMDVVDVDTRRAVYKLKVSGLLESATSNNITTYTNKGNIGVTDSFGERLNTGSTDINNEFFLVCRTTNKGRVRYEIWYNQRYSYNRHKFYFSLDEAHARTGITQHFTWNKMRVDNAADVAYAKAGVTAYMDSKKVNPTYIPTSSWGADVFKTTLSNDESYTNVTIFNNNLYSTTQVGVSTILNTTPYIDAKIKGYSGYKTIPSAQKTAEYRILSEDKGYLGGIRYDRDTNGYSTTRLSTCSTLSGANNAVALYASKGTADTKNTDANIWSFAPLTNNNINLGTDSKRWNNAYVKNIYADNIPLIPFYSDSLSTGTYRSTKLPSSHSLIYIEDRERRLSGYFYQGSGQLGFQELYFITNFYTDSTGQTTLTIYKLRINGTQVEKTYKYLFVSSSGVVEVGTEYAENGTFYYKVLK